MSISHLSCSGIDDSTDLEALLALQQEFEDRITLEWGILVMNGKKGGRYPSKETLSRTRESIENGLNVCAHLCGAIAKNVLKALPLPDELQDFQRYQLNVGSYQNQWDPVAHPVTDFRIPKAASYKLQSGKNLWVINTLAPDFISAGFQTSILLDTSRGRGKTGKNWSLAPRHIPTGFAGGITPENIATHIQELSATHSDFFICAESSLRTEDRFDLVKIRDCIEACLSA